MFGWFFFSGRDSTRQKYPRSHDLESQSNFLCIEHNDNTRRTNVAFFNRATGEGNKNTVNPPLEKAPLEGETLKGQVP